MTYKVRGDMKKLLPVTTFLLGAALTAALVFLNAALDVNWRPSALALWGNGTQPTPNPKVSDPLLLVLVVLVEYFCFHFSTLIVYRRFSKILRV